MLTREQIEEIQAASLDQGGAVKKILEERDIPSSQYFWWKRKFARHDVPEGFLPVVDGGLRYWSNSSVAWRKSSSMASR